MGESSQFQRRSSALPSLDPSDARFTRKISHNFA
jgi:hypothetical protein